MMQEESDAGSDGDAGKGDSGTIEPSDNVQNYEDGYTIEGAWARNRSGDSESGNNDSSGSGTIPTQKSTKYFWDSENRMIKAEHQGSTTHFQYDASGQRTSKKNGNKESLYFDKMWQSTYTSPNTNANHMEFKNIYLGKDRLLTKLGNGLYHDKSDNSYQKENQYFNHANHIGSVNVISDSKGDAFRYIEYTPYGEQWFVEDNRMQGPVGVGVLEYGFTDHLHDEETGLIYANARYLDPKTSRWMSSDPAMEKYFPGATEPENKPATDGSLPGSDLPARGLYNNVNLQVYHYAGNNPLKYSDPTGDWAVLIGIGGSAGAGVGGSFSGGIVIAKSDSGKYSISFYTSVAGGSAIGFGAGVGVEGGVNWSAQTVQDVEGSSLNTGGSVTFAVASVGLDFNSNLDTGEVEGFTVNVGLGGKLAGEGHAQVGHTAVASLNLTIENRINLEDYLVYDSELGRYVIYESDLSFLDNVSYQIAVNEDLIVP